MAQTRTPLAYGGMFLMAALPTLLLAAFLLAAPLSAEAAAKVVGTGTAGSCSETTLRTALAGGGHITFNCSAAPNPIVLTDELVITATTTIDGTNGGHPVTLSGNNVTRVLYLNPGVSLAVNNLTIQNGARPSGEGAAIYARGSLIVTNSRLYSNTAEAGGAIASLPGSVVTVTGSILAYNQSIANVGGAMRLRGPGFVSGSQFHHNTATTNGGAIFVDTNAALVVAAASAFYSNTADFGGALYFSGAGIVGDSRLHHNTALTGGAISTQTGSVVTLDNSEVDNNRTLNTSDLAQGGGIHSRGTLTVTDSHIHHNLVPVPMFSDSVGGGLYQEFGRLVLNAVDFDHNQARNGGGVFVWFGAGELANLNFSENRAEGGGGGGLRLYGGTVTLTGAEFDQNFATGTGGGIHFDLGTFSVTGATLTNNSTPGSGGGAYIDSGTVTFTDTTFLENHAIISGGGLYNYLGVVNLSGGAFQRNDSGQLGGAIANAPGGELHLRHLAILDNETHLAGGGIQNSGTLEAADVDISGNSATINGGGLHNTGQLSLGQSAVRDNIAVGAETDINQDTVLIGFGGGGIFNAGLAVIEDTLLAYNQTVVQHGGGVYNAGGFVLLSRSTLAFNSAGGRGGGLVNDHGEGGAINVTFSGNSAGQGGGGLWNLEGMNFLSFVTLTGNSAPVGGGLYNDSPYLTATVELEATLLAANTPGGNCARSVGSASVLSDGYNLSDDGSFNPVGGACPAFGPTDLTNSAPRLGPFSYGLGFTPVHPLLPGSPAIDVIPVDAPNGQECGTYLGHDQRALMRPTEGDGLGAANCDIGAFEFMPGEKPLHVWLPLALR